MLKQKYNLRSLPEALQLYHSSILLAFRSGENDHCTLLHLPTFGSYGGGAAIEVVFRNLRHKLG